jgi:serine/threonine-protein kinase RsbW
MARKELKMIITSKLSDVPLVGMAVNKICSSVGFGDVDAYQLELCVVEAVNNVIIHGYEREEDREVRVGLSLHPDDRVVFKIWDQGNPMTPPSCSEGVFESGDDIENLPEGGRGLHIIQGIMDDVAYERAGDWNVLTLTKRISSQRNRIDKVP